MTNFELNFDEFERVLRTAVIDDVLTYVGEMAVGRTLWNKKDMDGLVDHLLDMRRIEDEPIKQARLGDPEE
jgi:hypothetical protein